MTITILHDYVTHELLIESGLKYRCIIHIGYSERKQLGRKSEQLWVTRRLTVRNKTSRGSIQV